MYSCVSRLPLVQTGLCLLFTLENFLGRPFGKEVLFRVEIISYIILIWRSVILVTYSLVPALFGADLAQCWPRSWWTTTALPLQQSPPGLLQLWSGPLEASTPTVPTSTNPSAPIMLKIFFGQLFSISCRSYLIHSRNDGLSWVNGVAMINFDMVNEVVKFLKRSH